MKYFRNNTENGKRSQENVFGKSEKQDMVFIAKEGRCSSLLAYQRSVEEETLSQTVNTFLRNRNRIRDNSAVWQIEI